MTCVVLTQPAPRSEAIAGRLARTEGREVLPLPLTRICPRAGDPALQALLDGPPPDLVVFVSPSAVDSLAALVGGALDDHWPREVAFAAIGPGTVAALAQHGVDLRTRRVLAPAHPPFDATTLIEGSALRTLAPRVVVVVKGAGGREDWIATLRAGGSRVDEAIVYATEPNAPGPATLERLRSLAAAQAAAVFVVTQTATVERLGSLLDRLGIADWARTQPVLAIHPRIASTLDDAGWRRVVRIEPGDDALERGLAAVTQG